MKLIKELLLEIRGGEKDKKAFLKAAEVAIEKDLDVVHDVAADSGQIVNNVKHMGWFKLAVAHELATRQGQGDVFEDEEACNEGKEVSKKTLSVFDKHQLKIARDTLKMTDAGANVMGGPTKEEAREIIKRLTGKVVKESVETKQEGTLYVVFYQVIGERTTGSYLVNARDKREAKQIVQSINPDYARLVVMTTKDAAKEYSTNEKEFLQDIKIPKPGKATLIEAGT